MSRHAAPAGARERGNLQINAGGHGIPEWMRRALLTAPGISRLVRLREDARS